MAFEIRSFSVLTQAMVSWLAANPDLADGVLPTDLTVGSLNLSQLEAVAVLLEEYDQRVSDAIQQMVPEACFAAFGFSKLGPTKATGGVVLSSFVNVPYDVPIPTGAILVGPNGVLFQTTADGVITAGTNTSSSVPFEAIQAGPTGKVGPNTITRLAVPINFVDIVTNPLETLGGKDAESDDERAARFAAFLRTLVRGTKEALEFAAFTIPSGAIVDARAVEPFLLDPVPDGVPFAGLTWLFCDDGTLNTTLDTGVATELDHAVNGYVDGFGHKIAGYKAAGTIVAILKSLPVKVYLRAKVRVSQAGLARWADIQAAMTGAAQTYFSGLRISETVSYQNLVTVLTTCDKDIREVDLVFWKDGDTVPGYGDDLSANDLTLYDPATPMSIGSRARVVNATVSAISYPEWILT